MEIWRKIDGYNGKYEVSTKGNVRSSKQKITKLLKPAKQNQGYYFVSLYNKSIGKCFLVHRLVAMTFLPNLKNHTSVNHVDGDITNNKLSNLEWVSHLENMCHSVKNKIKTSIYTGVSYDIKRKKYMAFIRYNGKGHNLGRYVNEIDAYNARVNFELENNIINRYL